MASDILFIIIGFLLGFALAMLINTTYIDGACSDAKPMMNGGKLYTCKPLEAK